MKALVTGATGFIGSHLTEALVKDGWEVRVLIRKTSNLRWIRHLSLEYWTGELTMPETLNGIGDGVDVVFHCAAVLKGFRREDYMEGNLDATVNLVEALRESGIKRFVFISSQSAAGPSSKPINESTPEKPISFYGESKLLAEKFIKERSGLEYTIIRPSVVYGPRDKELLFYFRSLRKGYALLAGNPEVVKFVYVGDLVDAILKAATSTVAANKTYFVCGDENLSARELLSEIATAVGTRNPKILQFPCQVALPVVSFVATISSLLGRVSMVNPDKVRELCQEAWNCSNELAKRELKFTPSMPLREGLRLTVEWYKEFGWL